MKNIFLIVFIFTSSIASSQISNSDFLLGNQALLNGEYDLAIQYLNKVIKENKSLERAYLLRSQAYYGLTEYYKAIKDSEKVLAIKPDVVSEEDYKALWNMGVCNNSLENYLEALKYFQQAKEIDSADIRLYENSGYSYWGLGQLKSAKKEFQKMITSDSTSSKGYYGLGKTAYLNRDFDEAIAAFSNAIRLDPNYTMAYQNRGSAYMEKGDLEKCCLDWNRCLELGLNQLTPYVNQYCR